jgi:hypothetical protein
MMRVLNREGIEFREPGSVTMSPHNRLLRVADFRPIEFRRQANCRGEYLANAGVKTRGFGLVEVRFFDNRVFLL